MAFRILTGDALAILRTLDAGSAQCCVTSPPYWGLRDYGVDGQIGLERTPEEYVARLVEVFREVRRVLRDDGTLWLNLGDSYAGGGNGGGGSFAKDGIRTPMAGTDKNKRPAWKLGGNLVPEGLKPKDLVGIPWMVAFALRADGWYLRSEVIWEKPNGMPESVADRPTRNHEQLFLLSKSERYFYDAEAVKELAGKPRRCGKGSRADNDRDPAHGARKQDAVGKRTYAGFNARWDAKEDAGEVTGKRNRRSVWTIATHPFPDAHFATMPPGLVEPCIKAGCPIGGTVVDPFFGAGTVGLVATRLQRNVIGIELNPTYAAMAERRIIGDAPLLHWASDSNE